jgi:peptide/nickel transport system permease protein
VLRFLLGRLGTAVVTVLGVVTLVFLLVHLLPGDPVDALLGDDATQADREALRRRLRLDRSMPAQYVLFLGDVASGSLGESFRRPGVTVASRIAEVYPHTLVLAGAALLVAFSCALPLGAFAAVRRGRAADGVAQVLSLAGLAMPTVWLGPLLLLLFAIRWPVLPLPGDDEPGLAGLVLPALTLGGALMAILVRLTRTSLLDVLGELYIQAARARGLAEWRVVAKHGLRNALLPVITVGGAQLGALLGGAVITEKIFERPGIGTLFLEGFFARDIPVIQGCVLVTATTYVIVNLCTDLSYALLDPRVRVQA